MKKVLVTGGTVFVSRYVAEYYVKKGYHVYVLNRKSKPQPEGVTLIEADRHELGEKLRSYHFDIIIDTAYTGMDVELLLDAVGSYDDYILISSSAVYLEYCPQPMKEDMQIGENKYWGRYGTDKIAAEATLINRNPNAYILRPPYLYGQLNNVYREAFVFDCALNNRKFYLPQEGQMKLQFFHIDDLCKFIDILIDKRPTQHIFNVGNQEAVTIKDWVTMCYRVMNKEVSFVNVYDDVEQRNYFSFYNYEYYLDVSEQSKLMPKTKTLEEGLKESFEWYQGTSDLVSKKPFIDYIDQNLK